MIFCYGTDGSRLINSKLIKEEYQIWILVAATYGYVVQPRPYQGGKKGKQVASSTKLGSGEKVVLRLMECLTPTFSFDILIFMDNCFTFFCLLTHLGVNNIRATCIRKTGT